MFFRQWTDLARHCVSRLRSARQHLTHRPPRRRVRARSLGIPVAAEVCEPRLLLSTITVTSLADSLNAGKGVTLRDAIQAANTDTRVDGSVAGQAGVQNVIDFQAGLTGTISLSLGQMTISSTMKIDGLGAAHTIIDAQHNSKIFNITSSAGDVTLDNLAIENGKTTDVGISLHGTGEGGAIVSLSTGTLTVTNSILSGNSTTGNSAPGGAIYSGANGGSLVVTNTTLTGNATAGNSSPGGAIFCLGPMTVTNCTLSGNTTGNGNTGVSSYGGAIDSANGATVLTNCTLSGNSTVAHNAGGGAIDANGELVLTNCTLSGNFTSGANSAGGAIGSNGNLLVTNSTLSGNATAGTNSAGGAVTIYGKATFTNSTVVQNHAAVSNGGGINQAGTSTAVTLRNTILAQNVDNGAAPDLSPVAATVAITRSLIGDNTGSGLTAAPVGSPDANGNLIGTHVAPIDPKLGALATNGGPTQTMALLAGSPALNAGSSALATDPANGNVALTTDQRGAGFARIAGTVDMGAYEVQLLGTPTVNFLITNSHLPVLTGTYDQQHTTVLQVLVNGTTFVLGTSPQLTSNGVGNWRLTTTAMVPDGEYAVSVTATDPSGDVATNTTAIDLIVNTTAPAGMQLTGEYAVATPDTSVLSLASISQNGTQLTLNGSTTASAIVTSTTQLKVGGVNATYHDSQIMFGSAGTFANQVWTKLDLPSDFTNPAGAQVSIVANGNGVTFVDRNGTTSPGTWLTPTQLLCYGETVTVGTGPLAGELIWADGTIWSEAVHLTGTNNGSGTATIQAVPSRILVTDYLTGSGQTVHTVQTGTTNIVFVDGVGNMVLGNYSNPNTNVPQATAPNYPGFTASIVGDTITWTDGNSADTVVWTKTTSAAAAVTVTDYTNQNGVPVHVVENGTNAFVIVDGQGNTSLGHFLTATTGVADNYSTDVATFSGNQVIWSDGVFVWTQTSDPPLLISFTDADNVTSHVELLTSTTLVGLDGSLKGMNGTRLNGKIFWSNGQVWDNFDFDALNAFFESVGPTTLPAATINEAYTATLGVSNGSSSDTFAFTAGSLPSWLSLNSSTGVLSGTPTIAGSATFAISAGDSHTASLASNRDYTVTVNPASGNTVSAQSPAGGSTQSATPALPVSMTVTAVDPLILEGQTASFTIAITNTSNAAANNLSLKALLSGTGQWHLASGSAGPFVISNNELSLAPGTTLTAGQRIVGDVSYVTSAADAESLVGNLNCAATLQQGKQMAQSSANIGVLTTASLLSPPLAAAVTQEFQQAFFKWATWWGADSSAISFDVSAMVNAAVATGWVASSSSRSATETWTVGSTALFPITAVAGAVGATAGGLAYLGKGAPATSFTVTATAKAQFQVTVKLDSKLGAVAGQADCSLQFTLDGSPIYSTSVTIGDLKPDLKISSMGTATITGSVLASAGETPSPDLPFTVNTPTISDNIAISEALSAKLPFFGVTVSWTVKETLQSGMPNGYSWSIPDMVSLQIPISGASQSISNTIVSPFTGVMAQAFSTFIGGLGSTVGQLEGTSVDPTSGIKQNLSVALNVGQLAQMLQGQRHILIATATYTNGYSWSVNHTIHLIPSLSAPLGLNVDLVWTAGWSYSLNLSASIYTDGIAMSPNSSFVVKGSGSASLQASLIFGGSLFGVAVGAGPEVDIGINVAAGLVVSALNDSALSVAFDLSASANVALYADIDFWIFKIKVHVASWSWDLVNINISTTAPGPGQPGTANLTPPGNPDDGISQFLNALPGLSPTELGQLNEADLDIICTPAILEQKLSIQQLNGLLADPAITSSQASVVHQAITQEEQVLSAAQAAPPGWTGPDPYPGAADITLPPTAWANSLHFQWLNALPNTDASGDQYFQGSPTAGTGLQPGYFWKLQQGRAYQVQGSSVAEWPLQFLPANVFLTPPQPTLEQNYWTYIVVPTGAPGYLGPDPFPMPAPISTPADLINWQNSSYARWLTNHPNADASGAQYYQGSPTAGTGLQPGYFWKLQQGGAYQVQGSPVAEWPLPVLPADVFLTPPQPTLEQRNWTYIIVPAGAPGFIGPDPYPMPSPIDLVNQNSNFAQWLTNNPNTDASGAEYYQGSPTSSGGGLPQGYVWQLLDGQAAQVAFPYSRIRDQSISDLPVLPGSVLLQPPQFDAANPSEESPSGWTYTVAPAGAIVGT